MAIEGLSAVSPVILCDKYMGLLADEVETGGDGDVNLP
jgi:hypothetical protein